ncbi:calcyphosin-2 isoform X1 [Ictalurus furcatus]|uniref:calcyphosin-2 isoform X1 n=1 Tax=Ictalurus furcatus TaxID=66913 RepID=UPI002350D28A|nr:calcyphosin-2 isoform X1 [Ictalurus furcatus]
MNRRLKATRNLTRVTDGGRLRAISAPSRGPRPEEVPVLDLDRLRDREDEDAGVIPVAGKACAVLSALSWGSASPSNTLQEWDVGTAATQEGRVSVLASPQYSYRDLTIRSPSNHKANMEPCHELHQTQTDTSHARPRKLEAEGVTMERRRQAVMEQVMVDQLSRAVISDPEQNSANSENISARHKRTLHHTMVKTPKSLTENLLSYKLCFYARILSRCGREACRELIGFYFTCDQTLTVYEYRSFGKNRCNALPFIVRGVYRTRGRPYCLSDISQGANLRFSTDGPHVPENLRQRPYLTLRVTDVDEEAKSLLLVQFGETEHRLSAEEINDGKTLTTIQASVRERLKGRAVRTLIGLGRRLQSLDVKQNGIVGREQLRECLMEELSLSGQEVEAVWRVVGLQRERVVDYAEAMCAVTGDMNESRKAVFIKVYNKLDPNKTGSVSLTDIEKFYCVNHQLQRPEHGAELDFITCVRDAGRVTKHVSYAEFQDYYEGLSIEIPNDQVYINILRSTWNI